MGSRMTITSAKTASRLAWGQAALVQKTHPCATPVRMKASAITTPSDRTVATAAVPGCSVTRRQSRNRLATNAAVPTRSRRVDTTARPERQNCGQATATAQTTAATDSVRAVRKAKSPDRRMSPPTRSYSVPNYHHRIKGGSKYASVVTSVTLGSVELGLRGGDAPPVSHRRHGARHAAECCASSLLLFEKRHDHKCEPRSRGRCEREPGQPLEKGAVHRATVALPTSMHATRRRERRRASSSTGIRCDGCHCTLSRCVIVTGCAARARSPTPVAPTPTQGPPHSPPRGGPFSLGSISWEILSRSPERFL